MDEFPKNPNPSYATGPHPLPCRGPRPLPCRAAGVPMPASPRRPDPQSQPGYLTAPHHRHLPRTEGQGSAEGATWMCREAQQGSTGRHSLVESTEKNRTHSMLRAPPTPLPRHRLSHARKPATPRIPHDTPNPPAAPRDHPEPNLREAPQGVAWMVWGTAWKRRKAPLGYAVRNSREALESAAEICRKDRQRNATRRTIVEFPEKSRTHPLPPASARSSAVVLAHSPAALQALP